MVANPLAPSPERDAKIRAKANELWTADGKPDCGATAYHEQASEIIGMEEHPHAGEISVNDLPPPDRADIQVENAEIQENLGEFPERQTDQGDHAHFPEAKNERNAS
ncbi:hypothetical protein AA101099_1063 [Neoasaia chiangmaiensis NBRC 101099]|uniref:Uncharacterized protein n=1 Tax=Neoasaia chiangmaiensis TaxID=320497 RepID=A0A1U9KMW9_9PROT|nr:hypothetical protein [Neoasaia chiangmaiensis]AQS87137.1 hypothetical protein A0U93_03410 [Neoasaia chiangmaiensis]GBR38146.1 hypothetical protein AA101099_1063 [Neoasaia chiangmaiensis NBRC 101099]GEN16021.1 hypothetical protein NCH01_24520 [Neoasaia chiangmaiensis]